MRDCQSGIQTKLALHYIQTKRCKTHWLRKAEIKAVDKGYQAKNKERESRISILIKTNKTNSLLGANFPDPEILNCSKLITY